jgi:preprotein translocase subunit SecG
VLSKATTIMAGVFMVTCLALSVLRPRPPSVLDKVKTSVPSPAAPAAPASPAK